MNTSKVWKSTRVGRKFGEVRLVFRQERPAARKCYHFSPNQLQALVELFKVNSKPCLEDRKQVSKEIGLDVKAANAWFFRQRHKLAQTDHDIMLDTNQNRIKSPMHMRLETLDDASLEEAEIEKEMMLEDTNQIKAPMLETSTSLQQVVKHHEITLDDASQEEVEIEREMMLEDVNQNRIKTPIREISNYHQVEPNKHGYNNVEPKTSACQEHSEANVTLENLSTMLKKDQVKITIEPIESPDEEHIQEYSQEVDKISICNTSTCQDEQEIKTANDIITKEVIQTTEEPLPFIKRSSTRKNRGKVSKKRVGKFNSAQSEKLLYLFKVSSRPETEDRQKIAADLGLKLKAVNAWFCRQREKTTVLFQESQLDLTPIDKRLLNSVYETEHNPDPEWLQNLANFIETSVENVANWFRAKRAEKF